MTATIAHKATATVMVALGISIFGFTKNASADEQLQCMTAAVNQYCLTLALAFKMAAEQNGGNAAVDEFFKRMVEKSQNSKGYDLKDSTGEMFVTLATRAFKSRGIDAAGLCVGEDPEKLEQIGQIALNECAE